MNFKLKEYITIGLATIVSFPILYIAMLFFSGQARVEFGSRDDGQEKVEKVAIEKQSKYKDSLFAVNSKTFQALQAERTEIELERKRLVEQQARVEQLQSELESERTRIAQERVKLEKVVVKSDSLGVKKIKGLAKMYGAMRPAEAASILATLDNQLCAKIIKSINDDRQKARIISAFPREKAATISRILGTP